MKTHLLRHPHARFYFAGLLVLLLVLMVGAAPSGRAQQSEPVPDANGKIPYVPSPFPGVPSERTFAYQKALRTLTPEILRTLPDDSVLLADLFRFEATSRPGRSPERDMIEMEMWRRGDLAIQIVKNAYANPFTHDTPSEIGLWLRYRPWMKPEEFLPLARRWYELNRAKTPGYPNTYGALRLTTEFLCYWGEQQDKVLIDDYMNEYGNKSGLEEFWLKNFEERQELRAQGNPHGMPAWFFSKGFAQRQTSIPDCTKTYGEMKASQAVKDLQTSTLDTTPKTDDAKQNEEPVSSTPWSAIGEKMPDIMRLQPSDHPLSRTALDLIPRRPTWRVKPTRGSASHRA